MKSLIFYQRLPKVLGALSSVTRAKPKLNRMGGDSRPRGVEILVTICVTSTAVTAGLSVWSSLFFVIRYLFLEKNPLGAGLGRNIQNQR